MTGVEILAVEEVAIESAFNWMACFISFCVVVAIFVLFGTATSKRYDDLMHFLVGVVAGVIVGAAFGAAFGFGLSIPTVYENQYKVTISDEVKINEFLEKYEIIDQEGKIYTVRERGIEYETVGG